MLAASGISFISVSYLNSLVNDLTLSRNMTAFLAKKDLLLFGNFIIANNRRSVGYAKFSLLIMFVRLPKCFL